MVRTGLKIIATKGIRLFKHPSFLFDTKSTTFPETKIVGWKIRAEIYSLENELRKQFNPGSVGGFNFTPHNLSSLVWKKFVKYNPNNLGNWTINNDGLLGGTRKIEQKLIKMMISLFGGSESKWEGYVTSGATEANIFSMWLGRNYLTGKKKTKNICTIINSTTHYSIKKASNLINVVTYEAKLDRKTWKYDINYLEKTIRHLKSKKYDGFLLPITLGYTQTGVNEDYTVLVSRLRKLEKELDISLFFFLDAALNGLVLPFASKTFVPLSNSNIQTLCTDFHKGGMVALPCGIVIYRKELRKYIEKTIPYISENDNTLLGSRTGLSAVSAYFTVLALGKRGFSELLATRFKKKKIFIEMVKSTFEDIEIVEDKLGVSIGLVCKKMLKKEFLDKYGLFAKEHTYNFITGPEKLTIYKAIFLN